jgi:membrane protein YdbS with pleckstrin-like domain
MTEELIDQLAGDERFTDLSRGELRQMVDLVRRLREIEVFSALADSELLTIAAKSQIQRYERGETIIHEGDTDKVFYVILKGQVRVWTQQADGPRLLNYHDTGDFFGELAALTGAPRAANVDVMDDVVLVAMDEEAFALIAGNDQISRYLSTWGRERIRQSNRPFPGKRWDEISVVHAHKSWVALARVLSFPFVLVWLTWATWLMLLLFAHISSDLLLSLVIAVTIGMGLWSFWMWEDWRNDDLFVTSKRIIQIERILVPPFPVERHEAAIEHVQDITTRNHGLLTVLFGVQSLEIKTAGVGTIHFPYLADADGIREQIFRSRSLALARRSVEERSRIRQALFKELDRPVKDFTPLQSGETVDITPRHTGLLAVIDYLTPRSRVVLPDRIIWRKHWLVLVRAVALPAAMLCTSVAVWIAGILQLGPLHGLPWPLTVLLPGMLVLVTLGVYFWHYDGWRNDVYMVTDTRIIDIEGSPFHVRKETRTEGTFDVIQNTDYNSPGLFARIFRMGDVTIDTASKRRAFTFNSVARPEEVQQEIFKRLVAFRERRTMEESDRQYAEFAKWFETYHHTVIEKEE